ncbi:MAG: hypothetical protein WKF76_01325 [Nocardioidaceae bacterium]
MITYLLQSLSDLEISRRLDVSLRTVAYDVRGITDAVDASGRVDLGYKLRSLELAGVVVGDQSLC